MGVDAVMIVRRVPASIVNDEWLKAMSWNLCRSVGAKHFFTSDGLPPEQYRLAYDAWQAAFAAHPKHAELVALYEKASYTNRNRDEAAEADTKRRQIHSEIFADIGEPPKERRLAIDRTNVRYRDDDSPPPGTTYYESMRADPGECLLDVYLWGRYYGPGYERGDLLTYCAVAEWLETNISGCEVWYGGDSSEELELFDDAKRRELRAHLYSTHGRDYYTSSSWCSRTEYGTPAACSLCPDDIYRGQRFGAGQDYASFHCHGCGKSMQTRDGGKTWTEEKNRD